ncbi:MAG: TetR family transcriptional regulator [Pseudomonadota bacterium]
MTFQRARSAENKELRRAAILQAATRVLDRDGLPGTSLNAIAREAGMVKSGLYKYFESREEILLRLMLVDMADMTMALETTVIGPMKPDDLAVSIAQGFASRPRLCQFISQLAMTLERNVSGAVLRDIKLSLLEEGGRAAGAFCRALPGLTAEDAMLAVHMVFTLVAGHWPMATPSGDLKTLLEEPQFADFNHDFEPFLRVSLTAALAGLVNRAGKPVAG